MFESEVFEKMTLHAKQSISRSKELASDYGAHEARPLHLLMAIATEQGSLGAGMLSSIGLSSAAIRKRLGKISVSSRRKKTGELPLSPETKSILTRAYAIAGIFQYPYIGTEHLLYAILESADDETGAVLQKVKIGLADLESFLVQPVPADLPKEFSAPDITLSKRLPGTSSPLQHIEQFCTNLNQETAGSGNALIGREKELERLLDILGRRTKNNPLLIGDPGVGKTALVEGLARRINAGMVAPRLADKTVYSLDLALVVAGTTFRGEFEARLKEIIREASSDERILLFIDEVHGIVGAGNSQGALDAANILKPALASGALQCIGATTYAEYKKYIEKDPALARRFQPLKVAEPSAKDTAAMLEKTKRFYEDFHRVSIPKEAVVAAVELSVRYINDRFLPDKAIDLIDEASSAARNKAKDDPLAKRLRECENDLSKTSLEKSILTEKGRYEEAVALGKKETALRKSVDALKKKRSENGSKKSTVLSVSDIAEVVSRSTGIPLEKISPAHSPLGMQALEKKLEQKIVGQSPAMKAIGDTLARSHSGIADPSRPMGSFLFLGPTGVGKTLTAKILSQEIFANPKSLVRIDMSEFMEKHSLAQLIGAPAGYVGFEEGGKLTERIRHNPYSLVLFDEIEKAHPDMSNILLQILEDGTLTDAQGRSVDFTNTIIILTSNLGADEFARQAEIGFNAGKKGNAGLQEFSAIADGALSMLKKTLKPEILNRLDRVILFSALGSRDIAKIARAELAKLSSRLAKKGIRASFSPESMAFIAARSGSPEHGARAVRKNIQDLIEAPIARYILGGKAKNNTLKIDARNGGIIVK